MNKNFDTVLIIGITEDAVHLDHSMSEDALKVIGSIEALKDHYIKQWG